MKKTLLAIFIFLLSLGPVINVSAKDVDGLVEQLDSMWINSNMPMEQIIQTYSNHVDMLINQNLSTPEYARIKANLPLNDDELIDYVKNNSELNYSEAIQVFPLVTTKYMQQYSENHSLEYLTYGKPYISILKTNGEYSETFDTNGVYLNNSMSDYDICRKLVSSVIDADGMNFLKNTSAISTMLAEKGETFVKEAMLLVVDYEHTVLLIVCDNQEYLIQVYSGRFDTQDGDIEKYTLYTASEYVGKMTSNNLIKKEKDNFLTEAEALQAEGLLQGNENGLDLLKPLTRIEATAILVRAMGYEDVQTSEISYFADIQSDNWGAKYANIAKDKGIASGVGDDMFAPNDTITASQFATLILRNMGENPDWQTAINTFVERGLITSEQADKMDLFTRGDMAKIIYEAKQKNMF